ncbi:MAG: class I SAM-dependent methyltransferase [Deltaproteobacteria bacterium]
MPARKLPFIEHFGVARRFWWNADFLELMSRRWRLDEVSRALDVGCGAGHWTAVLTTLLPPSAEVVGVDRDHGWLELARQGVRDSASPNRPRFEPGVAESLPFPDASFDMVTCQTLLMHLPDPGAALREMRRVLEPGGLLAIVEPSNLVQTLLPGSPEAHDEVDDVLARVRFQLVCERGREALGEGAFSVGDRLADLVTSLGLKDVQVYQSNKAFPFFPPYDTNEQAAIVGEISADGADADGWIWSQDDSKRYFLKGGGTAAEFAIAWARIGARNRLERRGLADRTFHRTGGRIVYLVSGRK